MKNKYSSKWEIIPKEATKQLKGGNNPLPDLDTIFSPIFPCPLPFGG